MLGCSYCYSSGLASSSKISEKARSRRAIVTTEQPSVVTGNFPQGFPLKFLSNVVFISGSIEPINLIWGSLERSFPPIMPILVKGNDVRSGTKANACHGF